MKGASMQNTEIFGSTLSNIDMNSIDMGGPGSKIQDSVMDAVVAMGASSKFAGMAVDHSTISNSNFTGSDWAGGKISRSTITDSLFTGSRQAEFIAKDNTVITSPGRFIPGVGFERQSDDAEESETEAESSEAGQA